MAQMLYFLSVLGEFMKGLNYLLIAIAALPLTYNATAEIKQTAQNETPTPHIDILIVIDRNPKVQEARIYEDNMEIPKYTYKVSTGRETFDTPTNFKHNPYCATTNTGDFKPQLLRETNLSDTWLVRDKNGEFNTGSEMPHSIFFDGGIALHAADSASAINKLGPKDDPSNGGSGGCVRLAPENAKQLFDMIAKKDAQGKYVKIDPSHSSMCKDKPTLTKCKDEHQWPVARQNKKVAIRVIDSRSKEDQELVKKSCDEKKARFISYKASCIKDKMKDAKEEDSPFSAITKFFSKSEHHDFANDYKSLPKEQKIALNAECNKETYFKLKDIDKHTPPMPPVRPKELTAGNHKNPPQPPPRPFDVGTPNKPAQVVHKNDPKTKANPSKDEGSADGLWIDFSKKQ